jgi:hypothetical protein
LRETEGETRETPSSLRETILFLRERVTNKRPFNAIYVNLEKEQRADKDKILLCAYRN